MAFVNEGWVPVYTSLAKKVGITNAYVLSSFLQSKNCTESPYLGATTAYKHLGISEKVYRKALAELEDMNLLENEVHVEGSHKVFLRMGKINHVIRTGRFDWEEDDE